MNKLLKILGGIFLVLLVIAGISAAIFIRNGLALDKDAIAYFETNVPQIVESWDSEELVKRAAPETFIPTTQEQREQMQKTFAFLSKFGKLKQLDKPNGQVTVIDFQVAMGQSHITMANFPNTPSGGIWGEFVANAEFEAGPAQVEMVLQRTGSSWQIMGFHVKSPN